MFHHFIVDYYQVENFNMSDRYLTKAGMQILLASGLGGLQRTVGHFEVGLFPQRLLSFVSQIWMQALPKVCFFWSSGTSWTQAFGSGKRIL